MIRYKTLKGLLRNCGTQMTAENLFGQCKIYKRSKGILRASLSDEARREAADMFASYLYSTKGARREEVTKSLIDGRGDMSLFQCFYFEVDKRGRVRVSSSLSGEAFNYCKRKYLR